ncbi:hypothetical protein C8R46DRAFT_1308374 [Mycena filopes]|nr:hypothetical protein C8R46DRAFT_1308374 [Mycena filopes]
MAKMASSLCFCAVVCSCVPGSQLRGPTSGDVDDVVVGDKRVSTVTGYAGADIADVKRARFLLTFTIVLKILDPLPLPSPISLPLTWWTLDSASFVENGGK